MTLMNWTPIGPLALVMAGLCGCGGGSNTAMGVGAGDADTSVAHPDAGGGTCASTVVPCGGAVEGTWKIASVCSSGDVAAGLNSINADFGIFPSACSSLYRDFTLDMSGTVTYAAGVQSETMTMTLKGKMVYTPACLDGLSPGSGAALTAGSCADLGARNVSMGSVSSATCSVVDGNCACAVVMKMQTDRMEKYVVSGTQLTYPHGMYSPVDYCVHGTTLTMPGSQSLAIDNVVIVTTLQKQ